MARMNEPSTGARNGVRLLFLALLLTGGVVYLFGKPLQQVYWGVSGRISLSSHSSRAAGAAGDGSGVGTIDEPVTREGVAGKDEPLDDSIKPQDQTGGLVEWDESQDRPADSATDDGKLDSSATEAKATGKDALTRELIEPLAQDKYIMVTWANWHYRDFVGNWVYHLKKTGCSAFVVGAMDDKLLAWLQENGIPTFLMNSGLPTSDFGWGSKSFFKMGREKVGLVNAFLAMGFDVIISDVDTVWLRDPIPYMKRYPDADVLASSDVVSSTSRTEDLEGPASSRGVANIGIMLFRPKALAFAKEWTEAMEKDEKYWDQNAFNDILLSDAQDVPGRTDNLLKAYKGSLLVGILPVSIFCSGQTYKEGLFRKLGLEPYVIHATFQFSGTAGKRHRLREWGAWKDPPEWWTHPIGFLSYDNDVPEALLEAARTANLSYALPSTLPHFALVNHQLRSMRNALVLASELGGAATVLPSIWVGLDRWWAPHDGRLPNSRIDLPFAAPADLVLDLEMMSGKLPNGFREHSFLSKPEAAELNASRLLVTICQDAEEGCAAGDAAAEVQDGGVRLQPGRSLEQLRVALSGAFEKHKLLHFTGGMGRALILSPEEVERFGSRLNSFTSIHCCVKAPVGHIWYDLFWDIPGHTDRHQRTQQGEWKPQLGP
ncbi:AXT2 [Auxenochlorella protothecoides x Auxenochlorella symbiontica]